MDEANVKLNALALSMFRSACACLSDAPVSIVASSRAHLWCVSPMEAVPATICIFECAAATWFAAWACAATSTDMQNYLKLQQYLENQSFNNQQQQATQQQQQENSQIPASFISSYDGSAPTSLAARNEDTVSALISFVPVCWIRSTFQTMPPNAARHKNETRVDSAVYTVGSSKRNAAAMVPRMVVLSSVSTQFAHCLANVVAEHGGRTGTLPEASVFESLPSLRGEIVSRSIQMPFFNVAPDAGIDRITAQMPVLAETLALFEGSLYKPCVVLFHGAAMWTTADRPATDFMATLGGQCVTMTQQAVFFLSLPAHLPNSEQDMHRRAQLERHFCSGARLRLFDLETVFLCDDGRTVLLVSRNGCSSAHRHGDNVVLTSPCVVMRVHFPAREARAAFAGALLQQCESLKHPIVFDTAESGRVPRTILDLDLHSLEAEVIDIGSAVAVADTDYCTSIEASTRPMWPVTFPVFADGYELCEFWKLLALHTATLLVKLSRIVPATAHSSLALRITSCVTDVIGERWGRAFLIHRAATVVANCASVVQQYQQQGIKHEQQNARREDATLSVQVLRFLLVEASVFVARATTDAAGIVDAKDRIKELLRDVEALTLAKPTSTTDRNVPSVRWERIQEQILLVLVEGAMALGSDSDLVLSVVAPFAGPGGYAGTTAESLSIARSEAARHAPLADLSRMDSYMATALAAFPASLFCATHPLPALWRMVRPFLIPVLRSFFTRESFDSMFPSTTEDFFGATGGGVGSQQQQRLLLSENSAAQRERQRRSLGVLTEDTEVQTVDSPLWKLLRNSTSAEIESATAGQIYLNRLFGKTAVAALHDENLSRPAAPIVEDWLQLASMVQPNAGAAMLSSSQQQQAQQQQQQLQQQRSLQSPLARQTSSAVGFGGSDYLGNTPHQSGGLISTPIGGTPHAGATPIQAALPSNQNQNTALMLERRDVRIGELELKEQSLQATISALHDELATSRGELAQLLAERRSFRQTLLRERCDHLLDKEVCERRLLQGQEEVDRCGLHNFLIDKAIHESTQLLGEAAYRTIPGASSASARLMGRY